MARKSTASPSAPGPSGKASTRGAAGRTGKAPPTKRAPRPTAAKEATPGGGSGSGRQLVIVESPAKAKTINKYLGPDFQVLASVGHVADLPAKAPKGTKQPVPGVDLENDFEPSYEVLPEKRKTVAELRSAARKASQIWFATDLDREGEAIAWHLTQVLGIDPSTAKRVIFNAITKAEIQKAFEHPHSIDLFKVNAQQARRILDRIVGYQVSPLLWKKVARGLSAGRVQSVAVRLVVEREREIAAFVPDERWEISSRLAPPESAPQLVEPWQRFVATRDERNNPPTQRAQFAWLTEHTAIRAELVELGGKPFAIETTSTEARDLSAEVRRAAEAVGLLDVAIAAAIDPDGKGPARTRRTLTGAIDPKARYRVRSIETERRSTRPYAPFITSTLQQAASSMLSFGADRTMRVAQGLYEGVNLRSDGQVGLITYMRTDSTHVSGEALSMVRAYIGETYGPDYLPEKPNFFGSSNKSAQEAHEAIRPTDVRRTPDSVAKDLSEEQLKLYRLIWNRFVACQMTPARFDGTTVLLERSDRPTGAVLKATGRVLAFDGFYRVAGAPSAEDEQTLPRLTEGDVVGPFFLAATQKFTTPPPRFNEASLIRKLEEEGIGRPSTYASILRVIEDRGYVEQLERRYHATDVGMVVTDKLVEGFPELMDVGYTRSLEAELDKIEDAHTDWKSMLRGFYGGFSKALKRATEDLTHAKAEVEPAAFACPACGRRTQYRFGKNGRFLSCSGYPECAYAAPIDRQGQPQLPERVDVQCPEDGSQMVVRTGRFGKFLASVNYPEIRAVLNLDKKGRLKLPAPPALLTDLDCPTCNKAKLNLRSGKRGPWLGCSSFPKCRGRQAWTKLPPELRTTLEAALHEHERLHPPIVVKRLDGRPIPDGTPLADLALPGGVQELAIHPDVVRAKAG